MEESIYNIIPPEILPPLKPNRYKSNFPHNLAPTGSTFKNFTTANPGVNNISGSYIISKSPHNFQNKSATFGSLKRQQSQNLPPIFTKKSSGLMGNNSIIVWSKHGSAQRTLSPDEQIIHKTKLKPLVPKHTEKPLLGLKSQKNFVVLNAVDVILSEQQTKSEDPDWTKRKDYGKVPLYLSKIKDQLQEDYKISQSKYFEEQEALQNQKYMLSSEEIENLRFGLKKKWEEVNKKYQMITHIQKIDTVGLRRRKQNCEKELLQIEKDLEKLNRNYIFVDKSH